MTSRSSAQKVPTPLHFLILTVAGWVNRKQRDRIDYLQEENRILREHLGGRKIRFTDRQRIRLARKARKLGRKALLELDTVVTPDTLLRWYRRLVAQKYDGSQNRRTGRPKRPVSIEALILRMAEENPGWGYTRIQGALKNLGHEVGRTTIKRVLRENGLEPSEDRRMPWKTFLEAHFGSVAAMDFLTVEVLTWKGLARYLVLFVIDIGTRKVEIAGIRRDPDGRWMEQVARNLTDPEDGFLSGPRYVIHDRDSVVHGGVRSGAPWRGGRARAIARSESEPQCLRGAVRAIDQGRVPQPGDPARGEASALGDLGVCRALPRREEPSGDRERADRRSADARYGAGPMSGAAGWAIEVLLPGGGVREVDSTFGTLRDARMVTSRRRPAERPDRGTLCQGGLLEELAPEATVDDAALLDIEPRLRRVMGTIHLPKLREALKREPKIETEGAQYKAAA